jgi:hypothetical protein
MTTRRSTRRETEVCAEDTDADGGRFQITEQRLLRECARIVFADIRNIVGWDADGIMKPAKPADQLAEDDAAAIAEIVGAAKDARIYRVKMHDKKPLLVVLLRYLDTLPPASGADDDANPDDGEDPREFLKRELARIAARSRLD